MEIPDYDQLRRTYSLYTNGELARLVAESEGLTNEAKDAMRFEIRQRGLVEGQVPFSEPILAVSQILSESKHSKPSRLNWLWPSITNENEAKNAAKSGAGAALVVALLTGGIAVAAIVTGSSIAGIDGYSLADAFLFAVIAWRLFKYSFAWAVVGSILWLLEVLERLSNNPRSIGAMTVIITLGFVASVRGTSFLSGESKLRGPGLGVMYTPGIAEDSAQPSPRSRSFGFDAVPAVLICVACLVAIFYHRGRVKEKDATAALIAQLDNAEYKRVGVQIWKDIAALEEDYKGKDWSGFRREVLSREPYLIDLKAQNHEIQPRLQTERFANLGANDICERLALDELGPAVEAFTKAQDNLFSFARNTPKLTTDNTSASQLLADQETSAEQQLNQYIADMRGHGCDK